MRFQEFSKFVIRPHLFENKQQYKQILDTMVNADIIDQNEAQNVLNTIRPLLKRADRIIWWLRWYRIDKTGEVIESKAEKIKRQWELKQKRGVSGPDTPETEEEVSQKIAEVENLYKKITKKDYDYYLDNGLLMNAFTNDFNPNILQNHWVPMFEQSPQVNQVEWEANIDPLELVRRLQNAEREWKEKQKEELEMQPNDQIIIDYGKYAWVKLDREYCDLEGRAMGHCGNTGAPQEGDRILSFRTKVDGGRQKPHLTFILDRNGFLGEMKGRGNDKPSEKYHPYIVDLLQKDFVKGIKGGGYMPENNFDIGDLDKDVYEKLVDAKPALGGIDVLYEKQGLSKQVLDMFESQLDSSELDYEEVEDNRVVIDRFDNLSDIAEAFSVDRETTDIIDIVTTGDIDNHIENISSMVQGRISRQIIAGSAKELYNDLDDDTQEKIKQIARQETEGSVDTDDFEDMVEESVTVLNMFEDSLFNGIYLATQNKAKKLLDNWLAENNFEKVENKDQYQLVVPIAQMIDVMSNKNIKSVSDIEDWSDILYEISDFMMGIDIESVYVYDESIAKEHLKNEIEELTAMADEREENNAG